MSQIIKRFSTQKVAVFNSTGYAVLNTGKIGGPGSFIGQNDFEGTLQCAGGTDQFAIGAPPAIIHVDKGNLIFRHDQGAAPANCHTQPAAITLVLVKYRR